MQKIEIVFYKSTFPQVEPSSIEIKYSNLTNSEKLLTFKLFHEKITDEITKITIDEIEKTTKINN